VHKQTEGKGGRYNSYLTEEEEREFLAAFIEKAKQGQIATVKEIQQGFEKRVKSKVEESTIYRLLDRHKWRKIAPRPSHPKTNSAEQEELKKSFLIK
jgi:transposase